MQRPLLCGEEAPIDPWRIAPVHGPKANRFRPPSHSKRDSARAPACSIRWSYTESRHSQTTQEIRTQILAGSRIADGYVRSVRCQPTARTSQRTCVSRRPHRIRVPSRRRQVCLAANEVAISSFQGEMVPDTQMLRLLSGVHLP
jgi:hypothetical protein